MNTEEKRKTLSKWILETDENVLNEVEAIYNLKSKEKQSSNDIVAYTISGKALNKEKYIKKIKEAEASFDEGNFITSEELKKKMLSW
ncbi:hypothetical protein LPB03_11625 [Polaribacter vadi]|uniref:Uncharacterized protein n=1 Tax=Polaribacter vadi TaxID=1774273 RepID=A0A1B8TTE4_9FLAO|nr:hypothetical protein [Polaribacter vadi]AOW18060.1 hypothetical protein LPB03_11625 [Polaribacter vadi]OBY62788.1 hypothetical protein LPB3_11635 [Polaribacter vadi]